jgi:hypothetical protein
MRSLSIQPEVVPAASRTTLRAKAKATAATAATAAPKPVLESQVFDEFVPHSDDDDEDEIHEVEAGLQITAHSQGSSLSHIRLDYIMIIIGPRFDSNGIYTTESPARNQMHIGHMAKDLQTSRRVQSTAPRDAAVANLARDDDDSDDAELFSHVKRLTAHAPPVPGSSHRDRDQRSSSEEIFPSPGTRAGAEKRRRTQAAKAAPYVPPKGTRAASMIEKEQARSQ